MYMGLGFSLPQVAVLKLPAPITAILVADFVAVMIIFVIVLSKLLEKPTVLKAIGIGAFFVVLDWVNYTAVPIWGTAQSFARSWSWYPRLVGFESITGMGGVVFVVAALQALAVNGWMCPKLRRRGIVAGVVILAIAAGMSLTVMLNGESEKIKVAAVGWCSKSVDGDSVDIAKAEVFEKLFAAPVAEASRAGAVLAVTPEMGFYVDQYDYDQWLEKIKATAAANGISLVVGYFNAELDQNRLMFVDDTGEVGAEYTKTYLTLFENSENGNGDMKVVEVGSTSVGGMICQDDNFTSLSRIYGKMGISLVAVPTLDWRPVRNAHLQSSIHRAIESRYGIVRAALDGISAIIAPDGKVIGSFDHVENGPGMVIGEMEVYRCKTVFSRFGNWFVGLCGVSIMFCGVYRKKRTPRSESRLTDAEVGVLSGSSKIESVCDQSIREA
ncbi:MAG: hypothetical protein FVQ79_01140 [Planctomycetes bacterium]|nr:hypothetical protein [Planctomycetota bacterium]